MRLYLKYVAKHTPSHLLDSLKMSFSPGDLIWAKMKGFPHWPARVSSIYFEIKADGSEGLSYVEVEWKIEVL